MTAMSEIVVRGGVLRANAASPMSTEATNAAATTGDANA